MPIPETERKLSEAAFFLGHMTAEERKVPRNQPEAFGYYLSAFLSASRSVTFVLQTEAGGGDYRQWFDTWLAGRGAGERELLTFMNGQRRAEVHLEGAATVPDIEMVPITRVDIAHGPGVAGGPHPGYGFTWFGMPGETEVPTVGIVTHYFEDRKEPVVAGCARYLALLGELVHDFRNTHD